MKLIAIILSLLGVSVDLSTLAPTFCTPDHFVCVDGSFSVTYEGTRTSIRTIEPDLPAVLVFPIPVRQVDFYAHANPGEECFIPRATFCGVNTYDGGSFCITEYPLRRDANGCAYSIGIWAFGTPPHDEFLIETVEVVNLELWNLKIVPAG